MKSKEAFMFASMTTYVLSFELFLECSADVRLLRSGSTAPVVYQRILAVLLTELTILTLLITGLWLRRLWIASFAGFCLMPISRFGWQNRDKPLLRHELAEIIEWIKLNQVEYVANTENWMLSNWKKHSVASDAAGLPLQIIRWLRFSRCLVFCCVQHPGIFSR